MLWRDRDGWAKARAVTAHTTNPRPTLGGTPPRVSLNRAVWFMTPGLVLVVLVHLHVTDALDERVWRWVLHHGNATLEDLCRPLTHAAPALAKVLPVLLLVHAALRKRFAFTLWVMFAMGGAFALNRSLKFLVARPRPPEALWLTEAHGFSFPSGHTMGAAALATVLVIAVTPWLGPRARPWMLTLLATYALAVGLTRIALHVHFLTDVVAGWCLGAGWVHLVHGAIGARAQRREAQGEPR